jgi:trehalose 6-phosphate phosphatase
VSALPTIDLATTALFLDVDGTLLEFREDPAAVSADESLVELLVSLCAMLDGALSLVSGRPVADIDRIFAPAVLPAAGAHGAELRPNPAAATEVAAAALPDAVMTALVGFAARDDGLLLEKKPGGASLHYRKAPQLEVRCRRFMDELLPGIANDFRLIPGKFVFELAPRGHDKGLAIREMMRRTPFAGRRPVFFGDDVTDEDGFRAVNALDGLSVLVGEPRESAAGYALDSIPAVRQWLKSIVMQRPTRRKNGGILG